MNIPTWVTIAGMVFGAVGTAGIGGMLKTWLDHTRGTRKQSDDVAMGLVAVLETRVGTLEGKLEDADEGMKQERARCDAELGVHRHRINNQRTIIYSLLHLFDVPAGRRKEMLANVRAELAAMEQAEAAEKGIIAAAPLLLAPPPAE
jgi:hypothetical protein